MSSGVRRTRRETEQLMLDAGSDILLRTGVGFGAANLRYAEAFELLAAERGEKVTRGSVHHRIWQSQEAWQIDVVCEVVRRVGNQNHEVVADAVIGALTGLPTDTPTDRLQVLAEACRVGSLSFIDHMARTPSAALLAAVLAARNASTDDLPEHDRLTEQLAQIERNNAAQLLEAVLALVDALELHPLPRRALDRREAARALSATSVALGISHTIRLAHDDALTKQMMVVCPDGERRPWNLLGLGVWLVARGLFVAELPDGPAAKLVDQPEAST